jgi:hypothetical protein
MLTRGPRLDMTGPAGAWTGHATYIVATYIVATCIVGAAR